MLLAFSYLLTPDKPQPGITELTAQLVDLPTPTPSPVRVAPAPQPTVSKQHDAVRIKEPTHPVQREMPTAPPPESQARPAPETPPNTRQPAGNVLAARALFHPLPQIPDALRMEVMHAVAIARFEIAVDGSVTVTLVNGAPDPRINQSILNTLRTWRFFPALKNGQPQPSVQEVRIHLDVE